MEGDQFRKEREKQPCSQTALILTGMYSTPEGIANYLNGFFLLAIAERTLHQNLILYLLNITHPVPQSAHIYLLSSELLSGWFIATIFYKMLSLKKV